MKISAHRGAFKDDPTLPENSLEAFKRAIKWGVDSTELDVHKSVDGEYIVYHDSAIEINDKTFILKEFEFKNKEVTIPGATNKIPTLLEVIELCNGKIFLNIEVKDQFIGSEVNNFLKNNDLSQKNYMISSFNERVLSDIRKTDRETKLGYLYLGNPFTMKNIKKAIALKCDAIHPYYRFLTKRQISYATKKQLDINVWTVNGKNLKKFLTNDKISSVITDDVQLALEINLAG